MTEHTTLLDDLLAFCEDRRRLLWLALGILFGLALGDLLLYLLL